MLPNFFTNFLLTFFFIYREILLIPYTKLFQKLLLKKISHSKHYGLHRLIILIFSIKVHSIFCCCVCSAHRENDDIGLYLNSTFQPDNVTQFCFIYERFLTFMLWHTKYLLNKIFTFFVIMYILWILYNNKKMTKKHIIKYKFMFVYKRDQRSLKRETFPLTERL